VPPSVETLCAQLDHFFDGQRGDLVPPLRMSTTYARDAGYELLGPDYSRDQNPTYRIAEHVIATLEGGADAALFASGQAAGNAVLSILKPGERLALPTTGYHALLRRMAAHCAQMGIGVDRYEPGDADSLAAAIQPGHTRLVWLETPSNPLWRVVDIAAAARRAQAAGALLAVDNTAMTPLLQRPLSLGADLVMHSATKALNGHSDVLAGVLVAREGLEAWADIKAFRAAGGAVAGAFEAWLLARGLRTLPLRVERAAANALAVAEALRAHPRVAQILYPGLPDHPHHATHVAQTDSARGHGTLLSILVDGDAQTARRVACATQLMLRATSIGGVESLIEHRATVEGLDSPTPDTLLRLSIGIEAAQDIIDDLVQALNAA